MITPPLRCITCLQMTDTGLFFNWAPNDPLLYDSTRENYHHSMIASVQAFNGGGSLLETTWCTVLPNDGGESDDDVFG
jgi:hypothetical protein